MVKAIRVHAPGGPEVMQWEEVPMPEPKPDEVLIRQTVVGLNYIDVYYRSGLYKVPSYPITLGMEGTGIVEKVGEETEFFNVGDRVVYGGGPLGAYAEYRTIPERFLVKIPEEISDHQAAAIMVKGQTAHFLLKRTFHVQPGITMLVHAAAGGTGLLLCQWGKYLGATVIGTVGSDEKAEFVKANGCDHAIVYTRENVVERVKEITEGRKCNVVYDSIGQATFMQSLDCLMPFGLMVSFGQASGPIPPFDISLLVQKGSLFLTRPSLMHYKADTVEYITGAAELFSVVMRDIVKVNVGQSYYLKDAARAHQDLEARKTKGSSLLIIN